MSLIDTTNKVLVDTICDTFSTKETFHLPIYDDISTAAVPTMGGALAYNKATEQLYFSDGTSWNEVTSGKARCITNTAGDTQLCAENDDTITWKVADNIYSKFQTNGAWQVGIGTLASGSGSASTGETVSSGSIMSIGRGSIAQGYSEGSGSTIESTKDGSYAWGYSKANSGTSTIKSNGEGSLACGYAESTGGTSIIQTTGRGSFANGYCLNGTIEATSNGSAARGYCNGGTIRSSAQGAFTNGYVDTSGTLSNSTNGSFLGGVAKSSGTIQSSTGIGGNFAWGKVDNSGTITVNGEACFILGHCTGSSSSIMTNTSCEGNMLFGNCESGGTMELGGFSKGCFMFGHNETGGSISTEDSCKGSFVFGSTSSDSSLLIKENCVAGLVCGYATNNSNIIVGSSDSSEIHSVFARGYAYNGNIIWANNHGAMSSGTDLHGDHIASGEGSHAFGSGSTAEGDFSMTIGINAFARYRGQLAQSSGQSFGDSELPVSRGNSQCSSYVLRNSITGAGTVELFLDGPGASERIVIPDGATFTFCIFVIGRGDRSGTDIDASYSFEGIISRDGGTTSILSSTKTVIYETPLVAATIDCNLGSASNSLQVNVIGEGSSTIRFVACVQTTEVMLTR